MKTHESEEDLLSLTCNKRSRSGENTEPIPVDLIVEIFLRLPAKSIARCCCLSKRWASILRLPYFTDLFLTISSARPKLLFYCKKGGHVFFFSSPQPQSPNENSSLIAANCYRMKTPFQISFDRSSSSIRGLVLLKFDRGLMVNGSVIWNHSTGHASVICNPSTGQSLILPQVKSRTDKMKSYFGYDPIEKQYKVLSMTWVTYSNPWFTVCNEPQVLTLGGTGEPSWRNTECPIPHCPSEYYHICINGVLYYPAVHNSSGDLIIVCFDVRSEKFRFVKSTHDSFASPLINYNDKLASVRCHQNERLITIKLWVLEDAEKQEWSEQTYVLPAWCNSFVGDSDLRVVGMTRTNEIVLSSSRQSGSYYVFYYNIERNTVARVDIRGMEAFKHYDVYTFLDHIEDVKLMKMFN